MHLLEEMKCRAAWRRSPSSWCFLVCFCVFHFPTIHRCIGLFKVWRHRPQFPAVPQTLRELRWNEDLSDSVWTGARSPLVSPQLRRGSDIYRRKHIHQRRRLIICLILGPRTIPQVLTLPVGNRSVREMKLRFRQFVFPLTFLFEETQESGRIFGELVATWTFAAHIWSKITVTQERCSVQDVNFPDKWLFIDVTPGSSQVPLMCLSLVWGVKHGNT